MDEDLMNQANSIEAVTHTAGMRQLKIMNQVLQAYVMETTEVKENPEKYKTVLFARK
jgi:hypothetical protein